MVRCKDCGRIFGEGQVVLVAEDPSPRGITQLPPGREYYAYCPECGDDDLDFDFSLVDAVDIEEGSDETEVNISFNGKVANLYVDEDGILKFGWIKDIKPKTVKKSESEGRRVTA